MSHWEKLHTGLLLTATSFAKSREGSCTRELRKPLLANVSPLPMLAYFLNRSSFHFLSEPHQGYRLGNDTLERHISNGW